MFNSQSGEITIIVIGKLGLALYWKGCIFCFFPKKERKNIKNNNPPYTNISQDKEIKHKHVAFRNIQNLSNSTRILANYTNDRGQ